MKASILIVTKGGKVAAMPQGCEACDNGFYTVTELESNINLTPKMNEGEPVTIKVRRGTFVSRGIIGQ